MREKPLSTNKIDHFFKTSNMELSAIVNRMDEIIGDKHWLSVGSYKENILKKALAKVVPRKYSISSGFVMSASNNGDLARSSQTDIIIWDSMNYSPVYQDDDFVIIPPEACKIMIEVKGTLSSKEINKTLGNFDMISRFKSQHIKKYIFSYGTNKLPFPIGVFNSIANSYSKSKNIPLEMRMQEMNGWPLEHKIWPSLSVDGIFILSDGFIIKNVRGFKNERCPRFLFYAFTEEKDETRVYSHFETEILTSLGTKSNGRQGLYYIDQEGLLSLRNEIKNTSPSTPKSLMIFPKISKKNLAGISEEIIYDEFIDSFTPSSPSTLPETSPAPGTSP